LIFFKADEKFQRKLEEKSNKDRTKRIVVEEKEAVTAQREAVKEITKGQVRVRSWVRVMLGRRARVRV
jgi:hypothetical protein